MFFLQIKVLYLFSYTWDSDKLIQASDTVLAISCDSQK